MRAQRSGLVSTLALLTLTFKAAADTPATATQTAPAAATPPPLAAFAATPAMRYVELSPGGKMLAWLDTTQGDQRIVLFDLSAKKELRVLAIDPKMTFHWLGWSDDNTLLYSVSVNQVVPSRGKAGPDLQYEYDRVFATSVTEPTPRMLLSANSLFAYNTRVSVLRRHTDTPNTILMSAGEMATISQQKHNDVPGHVSYDAFVPIVYKVDTSTGKGTPIEYGDPYTNTWFSSPDGKILARGEWYWDTKTYSLQVRQGSLWHEIYKRPGPTLPNVAGLDFIHKAVLIIDRDSDGRAKLWGIPLDGSPKTIVFQDPTEDVDGAFFNPATSVLEGVYVSGPTHKTVWLDKEEEKRRAILSHSFPTQHWTGISESTDQQLLVFRVYGASTPPIYYLLDFKTNQASIVGSEYPGLEGAKLGEVKELSYKARDGSTIPGFLTLPPGATQAPLPLVVFPHGGPADRDTDIQFEWERQYLATRGYAVFQPQFRGSTGYGDNFFLAGKRQWGRLMQDDITDGVHALIDQGQVDPHRVCIVGYSYGSGYAGYAALAGAAFTPDLYKCVVSVNGISDLPRFTGYEIETKGAKSPAVFYWNEYLGEHSDPTLVASSPDRVAERITAPVLLIYSDGDVIVPANQSQLMAEALQKAGRNVQLIELPDADHLLQHPAARIKSLEEISKFLQNHL